MVIGSCTSSRRTLHQLTQVQLTGLVDCRESPESHNDEEIELREGLIEAILASGVGGHFVSQTDVTTRLTNMTFRLIFWHREYCIASA